MKNYKVLSHNPITGRTVILGEIEAQNATEAKREGFTLHHKHIGLGEQLVIASKTQYERGWKEKVEATEAQAKAAREAAKRNVSKTTDALAKKEIANCGRWCEVTMKKNGDVVKVERVGYGPMERPEWDAHKVFVNGIEQFGLEFKNLAQVAAWMCENY